ncbi:hypothetical protein FKM82_018222 [Ascaphus truei]
MWAPDTLLRLGLKLRASVLALRLRYISGLPLGGGSGSCKKCGAYHSGNLDHTPFCIYSIIRALVNPGICRSVSSRSSKGSDTGTWLMVNTWRGDA